MSEEKPEIQRADASARRRAAIFLVALAIIGTAAIVVAEGLVSDIAELAGEDLRRATERLGLVLKLLAVALALGLALSGGWLARLGLRTLRAGRFPPPDHQVARDTRVLHGERARRRALALIGLASVLLLAGLAVCALVWRLVGSLAAGTG